MPLLRYFPLVLACVITLILQALSSAEFPIVYIRSAILAGEWWRLFFGGWIHHNLVHLVMNLLALCLIWLLLSRHRPPWCCLFLLSIQVVMVDLALLLFSPMTEYYWGLSGALHGLFALAAFDLIVQKEKQGWWWLLGLLAKLLWDSVHTDSWTSELIATRVHAESHWLGAVSGMVIGLLLVGWRRWKQ